jgi:hypothetical protein
MLTLLGWRDFFFFFPPPYSFLSYFPVFPFCFRYDPVGIPNGFPAGLDGLMEDSLYGAEYRRTCVRKPFCSTCTRMHGKAERGVGESGRILKREGGTVEEIVRA